MLFNSLTGRENRPSQGSWSVSFLDWAEFITAWRWKIWVAAGLQRTNRLIEANGGIPGVREGGKKSMEVSTVAGRKRRGEEEPQEYNSGKMLEQGPDFLWRNIRISGGETRNRQAWERDPEAAAQASVVVVKVLAQPPVPLHIRSGGSHVQWGRGDDGQTDT